MKFAHAMSLATLLALCIAFCIVAGGLESDMGVSMACFPEIGHRLYRQGTSARDPQ